MIKIKDIYESAIVPALKLLPPKMSDKRAVVMMLARVTLDSSPTNQRSSPWLVENRKSYGNEKRD